MPQVIALAGAIGAGVLAAEGLLVAGFVLSAATGVASAKMSQREQQRRIKSQQKRAREEGIRLNIQSSVEPIPVAYGFVHRISGALVFVFSGRRQAEVVEDNQDRLHCVVAWCEGEIAKYLTYTNSAHGTQEAVFIDQWPVHDDRWFENGEQWWADASHHTGSDTQAADDLILYFASIDTRLAARWTTAHRLRGVAYSYITLVYNPDKLGQMPVFTASVEGKRITHPVTGAAIQSLHPVWAIYDYLTNARYGMGMSVTDIDVDSFDAAHVYASARISTAGATTTQYRFECNGLLDPDNDQLDNLRELLSCCDGMLVSANGKIRIVLDKPEVPVFDFNDTNMIGGFSIQLDSHGQRYNRVRAQFVNQAKESQPDYVIVDSPAYRLADGDELLQFDMELPFCIREGQARYLATLALKRSRYSAIVTLNATSEALRCEIGDVVTVTHEVPGWSGETFRVIGLKLLHDETVEVTLREYNDDVYDVTQVEDEDPIGTDLDDPFVVDVVTGLTLTPTRIVTTVGTYIYGIDVNWTPQDTLQRNIVGYHLEYKTTASSQWSHLVIARADADSQVLSGLADETSYDVRVRAYNTLGATSAWATASVTTLNDDEPAGTYVSSGIIADPGVTTQSLWDLSVNTSWSDTGGPDGGACFTLQATSPAMFSPTVYAVRGPSGANQEKNWPITDTDNRFHIWATVKKNGTGTLFGRFGVQYRSYAETGSLAATQFVTYDMSSLPVNEWTTIGPIELGPFDNTLDGNPSAGAKPHRMIFLVQKDSAYTPGFSVASVHMIRLEV